MMTRTVCLVIFVLGAMNAGTAADKVKLAEQFLRAIYPEVDGQAVVLTVEPLIPSAPPDLILGPKLEMFNVGLRETVSMAEVDTDEPGCGPLLVSGTFLFGEETVVQISVHGPLANRMRWRRLREMVNNQAGWSDEDVLRAMRDEGALFGPNAKAELLRNLPLKRLEPLWGTATVISAEFRVRNPNSREGDSLRTELTWKIEIDVQKPGQGKLRYAVFCEPIGGKIVQIIGGRPSVVGGSE